MEKQIIVRISGGLGNQMFQYAMAYVLSKRYPDKIVKLDVTWYRQIHVHNGFELFTIFNNDVHKLSLEAATDAEIRRAGKSLFTPVMPRCCWSNWMEPLRSKIEWHLQKWRRKRNTSSILDENVCKKQGFSSEIIDKKLRDMTSNIRCIRGYWQQYTYIRDYINEIKQEFLFPKLDSENQKLVESIQKCEAVSVHVRRGDYIGSCFDVLPLDYYEKAINYVYTILEEPKFFFFSDDEKYISEKFEWIPNKIIVRGNRGKDKYYCKLFI